MSKNLIIFNTYHFQMSSIPDYEFEKTLEWESLDLENLEQAFNNMKNDNPSSEISYISDYDVSGYEPDSD